MKQPHRLANERQAAIQHVLYEWTMLLSTCGLLRASNDQAVRSQLPNGAFYAYLESFVVHFRNLYEFLFLSQKDGYVRAADYLPSTTAPVAMLGLLSPILKQWFPEASEQVEHLSYGRNWKKPDQRDWPFLEITAAMVNPFRLFLQSVEFENKQSLLDEFDKQVSEFGFPNPIPSPSKEETLQNLASAGVNYTAKTVANTPASGKPYGFGLQ